MPSKILPIYRILLSSALLVNAQKEKPWPDSTIHTILLPTDLPPEEPEDSYECVFENVTQYYDVPKPTGRLLDAFFDYSDELFKDCTEDDYYKCFPEKEQWCPFMTERPASVASDLSAWGSTVSSWWAVHSSQAVQVARECPQYWFEAGVEVLDGRTWLNKTIIFAGCQENAEPADGTTTTGARTTSHPTTAAPASREDQTNAASTTRLDEGAAAANMPRWNAQETWKVAGGMAAAIANAVL